MQSIKIPIEGLLDKFERELMEHGLAVTSRLHVLRYCTKLLYMHEEKDVEFLDYAIIAEYSKAMWEKYEKGETGRKYYNTTICNVKRFIEFAETGAIEWTNPAKGSTYSLEPDFQQIADDYINDCGLHPNTKNDARWIVHKYFAWLAKQGYKNLDGLGAGQLQKFLVFCAGSMTINSMHNVKLYLKKLYTHLYETGQSESSYREFLSFKVKRETKISPILSCNDLAKILTAIDRTTIQGKRDYAIMLLGAGLGLRACDINALKLTDINWATGEINLIQSKTGYFVALPLTKSVGEALKDYIIHGRLNRKEQRVFLCLKSPYNPIKSPVTLGEIYRERCRAVGVEDGNRFHTLRRTFATSLVTGGVDIYKVAQALGDIEIESTKPYVALNSKHLKLCALSFDGIAPKGGAVK